MSEGENGVCVCVCVSVCVCEFFIEMSLQQWDGENVLISAEHKNSIHKYCALEIVIRVISINIANT